MKDFPILIEINSLHLQTIKHRQLIASHQERIQLLDRKKAQSLAQQHQQQEELTTLSRQISSEEQRLENSEKKLKNNQSHLPYITNQAQMTAQEKELVELTQEITKIQEILFQCWEKQESLEVAIREQTNFLTGLQVTRTEIVAEVNQAIIQENGHLEQLNSRIALLLQELASTHLPEVRQLIQEFPHSSFVCFVHNFACNQCRLQVSKHFQQQLERGQLWERCPHCRRLFIPSELTY